MTDAQLSKLRPANSSSAAIWSAINAVEAEREAAKVRLADARASYDARLLTGTTSELHAVETAIGDAERDLVQLERMHPALETAYGAALEAEAVVARDAKLREAAEAVTKYNEWVDREYAKHAAAIAEGMALGKHAEHLVNVLRNGHGSVPSGCPTFRWAYHGNQPGSLALQVKLPAVEPAAPAFWWQADPNAPTGAAGAYARGN